jgi:hypothetical protein
VVTNVYPDAQDPAIADSLRTAATATVLGREVVLHLADAEDMALASVDNGAAADEVWLDRSFDGGLSWSEGERLGLSTVPAGATTGRTMMYNIDAYQAPDSTTLRLGAVRACVRPRTCARRATRPARSMEPCWPDR